MGAGIFVRGGLTVLLVAIGSAITHAQSERAQSATSSELQVYEQRALTRKGNVERGRALFADAKRTKCATCHKVAGQGGTVGPDLSAIGGKFDRPHLIESLLEPSRQIVEGYRATVFVLNSGKSVTGIVKSESKTSISIIDADNKPRTITRADIDEAVVSPVSIMPAGLAKLMRPGEFTDLIAYLESLRPGKVKMGGSVAGPIQLPDGFVVETVVTGITGATALDILPDGRVLVCEQTGRVRMIANDQLLPAPFVSLDVDSSWERGVIGVTHHPNFPREPWVYVCYVSNDEFPHHRVSRFRLQDNQAVAGSEQILLRGDDQNTMGGKVKNGHQGGALHFGQDGKLYIAIGEQTAARPAQKLDSFLGKLLRINADGTIPADNPFLNQTEGKYAAIWARGLRNPFTFAVRKPDGLMFVNDVGGKFEEINQAQPGANYGWPTANHGPVNGSAKDQFVGPVHWYPESSINGGDFCPVNSDWPDTFHGHYVFGDYKQGWLKIIDPKDPQRARDFAANIRRPVDLQFALDGSLYVLLRNAWVIDGKFQQHSGSLLRIRFKAVSD